MRAGFSSQHAQRAILHARLFVQQHQRFGPTAADQGQVTLDPAQVIVTVKAADNQYQVDVGGDYLLLDNIAVDPARHGQGIGRRLLDFTEAEARRRGYGAVELYTNEVMVENIAMPQRKAMVIQTISIRCRGSFHHRRFFGGRSAMAIS